MEEPASECQFANDAVGARHSEQHLQRLRRRGLPTYDAGNITVQKNLFENALASSEAIQIKAATVTGGCNDSQVLDNVFSAATNNGGAD